MFSFLQTSLGSSGALGLEDADVAVMVGPDTLARALTAGRARVVDLCVARGVRLAPDALARHTPPDAAALRRFIELGAAVTTAALARAAEHGTEDVVREMLDPLGDLPQRADRVAPAAPVRLDGLVCHAARAGRTGVLRLALGCGGSPDARYGPEGMRALEFALADGRAESARLLLESGAAVHAGDASKIIALGDLETAAALANKMGALEVIEQAVDDGAHALAVALVARCGVETAGSVPLQVDAAACAPLISAAAREGAVELVRALIEIGAPVVETDTSDDILVAAVEGGSGGLVAMLLAHPRAAACSRPAALAAAATLGHTHIVQLLLPHTDAADHAAALVAAAKALEPDAVAALLAALADDPGRRATAVRDAAKAARARGVDRPGSISLRVDKERASQVRALLASVV